MAKPIFIRDQEGSYVIIGSNAGFNTHPAWFHNLKHKPQVTIQVKDKEFKVNAEVAGPGRRNQLWLSWRRSMTTTQKRPAERFQW